MNLIVGRGGGDVCIGIHPLSDTLFSGQTTRVRSLKSKSRKLANAHGKAGVWCVDGVILVVGLVHG